MKDLMFLLAQALFAAFGLRCLVVYSYRYLVHPLQSYPGPFIAKFSDWYSAYYSLQRRLHVITYQNHQKYGMIMRSTRNLLLADKNTSCPVIRQGPNKLVFSSVQAVQNIYHNDRLLKSRAYLVTQIAPSVYNLFNVIDKQLHRTKRRIVGQGVNERAVRHFEPVMQEQITIYLRQLLKSSTEDRAINMSQTLSWLTLDVSGELGFGRSFNLQTDTRNRWLPKGISTSNWRINVYIQFPGIKYTGWEKVLQPLLLPKVVRFHKLISAMIEARLSKEKDARPDLFAATSDFKDPESGQGLSRRELWYESTFFIPAGGDTVASLLSASFFYLSRHPTVYERLSTEVRDTFASADEIRAGPKLSGCSYLRACIDETLRISPPSGTTLWRDVPTDTASAPVIVDGHDIPPGTQVGVNIYALHHNEAYFPSPFTFKPERWLPAESGLDPEQTKAMHSAFMPFSRGSRNCAGTPVAYAEASLVLARTLWYFDFERDGNDKDSAERERPLVFQMEDQVGSRHTGPLLKFRPRGDAGKDLSEG